MAQVQEKQLTLEELKQKFPGKKYLSGARMRDATYVVRPSRTTVDHGFVQHTAPLRAKFRDHHFNSGSAEMWEQYENFVRENPHFTHEEVKNIVERHLETHGDWGRVDGRGLFPDMTDTVTATHAQLVEKAAQSEKPLVMRCQFYSDVEGESVQCEHTAEPQDPNMLCATHAEQLSAVI